MNLNQLSDQDLHLQTKSLIGQERQLLTKILHHLKEIERRRLFSDFGCSSLFDYTVRMLGYSEGQAQRRIQAMRLMKELPEIESKIVDGSLSLSNISNAQTTFNDLKRQNNNQPVDKAKKKEVLSRLENLSARDGQRELFKMFPDTSANKERERDVGEQRTEVKFFVDKELRKKLEEIRSLLGPKGAKLSYAELFSCIAELSLHQLKAKAFGKKRANKGDDQKQIEERSATSRKVLLPTSTATSTATSAVRSTAKSRYVPAKMKHEVWLRDRGRCCQCGSQRNLNYDHILPVAKQGPTTVENLRLLCFQCNQRAAIKEFGVEFMEQQVEVKRRKYG